LEKLKPKLDQLDSGQKQLEAACAKVENSPGHLSEEIGKFRSQAQTDKPPQPATEPQSARSVVWDTPPVHWTRSGWLSSDSVAEFSSRKVCIRQKRHN
jgi:hypothetical protein